MESGTGVPVNSEERHCDELARFLRETILARNFLSLAKDRCNRNWKCSPEGWAFSGMYTSSDFCRNRSCCSFMPARTCSCIQAKYLQIKIRKVCRTRFWKRWPLDCQWSRRVMVEFRKRLITGAPGFWLPRKITLD